MRIGWPVHWCIRLFITDRSPACTWRGISVHKDAQSISGARQLKLWRCTVREKNSRKNGGLSVTYRPDKLFSRQNGLRALKQAKKQVNECATLCSFWADTFRCVFDVKVCLASQYLSALVCPETSSVCAPDREAIRRSLDILCLSPLLFFLFSMKAI